MSFPDKAQRKACWDSRDRYWECLDNENIKDSSIRPKACTEIRKIFEKSCPTQWVTHFDRKRDFNVFKEKMQKEGYEPIKEAQDLNQAIDVDIMEELMTKINCPTNELNSEIIQEVLSKAKINCKESNLNIQFWSEVSQILWQHLQTGLKKFDDQLLCSTCFYTVLTLTNKQDFYLNEILEIINHEADLNETDTEKTSLAVSLMYGIFQSAFLLQKDMRNVNMLATILETMFKLLMKMAYQYSKFTFIVFKTISSFKKVCDTDLQDLLFNSENQVKLLNLVNHNWENPITGVRDQNKVIFCSIISVIDEAMYKAMLVEINGFYWNKAKYLMITEVIDQYNKDFIALISGHDWIDGLVYSLHKPGLVSAGADMYFAALNKLRSEEEWCKIFLTHITKILCGSSNKAIENLSNYWCLITFKRFPSLIQILINELEISAITEQKLYGSLSILKQANKLGQVNKNWELKDNHKKIKKMIHDSLDNAKTYVRMLAFDIICVSQGKTIPTGIEYELVLNYLHNNINSDCTVLRLSMLNSLNSVLLNETPQLNDVINIILLAVVTD